MINPGLEGKTVLITGVNNPEGIGAATARAFGAQGARLLLTYLEPEEEVGTRPDEPGSERYRWLNQQRPEELVDELRSSGVTVSAGAFDFAQDGAVRDLFQWSEAEAGNVDALVSNAAIAEPDSFAKSGPALVRETAGRHWRINAEIPALLIQEMVRSRGEESMRGGSAVVISTDAALGHAGSASYAASKNALESYARTAAWELGPLGFRVNVVSPGPVQTGWINDADRKQIEEYLPLRRLGKAEEIADAVVFLSSAQAAWITGQVLFVGGGNTMR